ncbi:UNVERIFIED_CONTAM: hypothetical protein GTU68_061973 [Idotea baltica]|nr:hypothetical protein [Idotea baltica]
MKKKILYITVFIFISFNLYADFVVNVRSGIIKKPLVAVISNNMIDGFSKSVNSVVEEDLAHNAKLESSMPIQYEVKSQNLVPWKNIKADYVAYTKYTKNSYNNYTVEVKVLKRDDSSYIQSITYRNISAALSRTLAHKISNYIYKKITTEQGFFLTKLAYVKVTNPYSRYGRTYELIISDYDGYNKHTVLTQKDNPIATPSWSSDGKFIVYSSYSGGSMAVYKLQIATGKVTRISNFKGINSAAAYSPNDDMIALALSKGYSDQTNIYIMNLVNKSLKRLTINGINTAPKFSPNGKSVIFTSDRGGRPNIYVAAINSKYPQSSRLSSKIYQGYEPNYTPDGKDVVFMNQSARSKGTRIAVFDISNSDLKILTNGKSDASPTVSPFGDMVAYVASNSRGYNSIDMVSLTGDNHFSIVNIDDNKTLIQSPSWSPKNF